MTNKNKYEHNRKLVNKCLDYLEQCRFKSGSKLDKAYLTLNNSLDHDNAQIKKDTDYETNDY